MLVRFSLMKEYLSHMMIWPSCFYHPGLLKKEMWEVYNHSAQNWITKVNKFDSS